MTSVREQNTSFYYRWVLVIASLALLTVMMAARPAHASTTFTVNSTGDNADQFLDDGKCGTGNISKAQGTDECTLRAAIEQSNATPGEDVINFDILGTELHTIQVNASGPGPLPNVTDPVTIDGYTQPGASPNTLVKGTNAKLMIQLDGSSNLGRPGLTINAPGVVVKGLVIDHFTTSMEVMGGASSTRIEGNFIGTDPSGTLAQGNSGSGVLVSDNSGPTNNTVGGSGPAARNLISGNTGDGVRLSYSEGNKVYGNLIGTSKDGKHALGNGGSGVAIFSSYLNQASNNSIGSLYKSYANAIAFNGGDGVSVYDDGSASTGLVAEAVLTNSIFSNKGLGIDLANNGLTPNDAGDGDKGANNLQNYPVLSSATRSAGRTTVAGKLNSNHDESFKVQFFSNAKGSNEGKRYLGSRTVTTDGSGHVSFTFSTFKYIAPRQNITATATNTSTGDTSEFSAPKKVVAS